MGVFSFIKRDKVNTQRFDGQKWANLTKKEIKENAPGLYRKVTRHPSGRYTVGKESEHGL